MVGYQKINTPELLKSKEMLNLEMYCSEMNDLNNAFKEKGRALVNRKQMILHYCNTRPYAALATCQKFADLGGETCSTK